MKLEKIISFSLLKIKENEVEKNFLEHVASSNNVTNLNRDGIFFFKL